MSSQTSCPVERYAALITKHIGSMNLVRLTSALQPLFPYECEIPAGLSMYPVSGGHSRTGSPPVVQFVGFLGRIRFTPHDEKVLPMDDIQLYRNIKLRLNYYYLPHTVLTSMCINNASIFLACHQLVAKFSSHFIEIVCTLRGTFLRINGKTTLSPLDAAAARRWRCSNCQS